MLEILLIDPRNPGLTLEFALFEDKEDKEDKKYFVGRDPGCDIFVDDMLISKEHGCFLLEENCYYYLDLNSKNGSKINNSDLTSGKKHPITISDSIAIGNRYLLVKSINGTKSYKLVSSSPKAYMPVAFADKILTWDLEILKLKCNQIKQETPDVKTFVFVAEPPVIFDYQPGQFVRLQLDIDNEKVERLYSISSTPSRPHTLEITVKRMRSPQDSFDVPPGLVSNWLHDNLTVNSTIEASLPMGRFSLFNHPSRKVLLIGAGSGITPLMSMSRWVCDTTSLVDVALIYSAKTVEDIIYRQELELISQSHHNFNMAIALTEAKPNTSWSGYRGRINRALIESLCPDFRERTIFLCGPSPFMANIKNILEQLKFPMKNLVAESFGERKSKSTLIRDNSVDLAVEEIEKSQSEVSFTNSNVTASCDEGTTILEVAEIHGVKIPFSCRAGLCGACKVKYSGQLQCEDETIVPQVGYALACVAVPNNSVEVEA